jgi:Uma2 family endonuclease
MADGLRCRRASILGGMRVELSTAASPSPSSDLGPYRLADYDRLPDQPRQELLFGRLLAVPSPNVRHQTVVALLWQHLRRCAGRTRGRAFLAPLDVVLAEHSVVQPDVFYVAAAHKAIMSYGRAMRAPDLVVEVLSPSTAERDRGEKLWGYLKAGVREYWLVDPENRTFEFLVNDEGRFLAVSPASGKFHSPGVAGIHIDVIRFWNEFDAERF